MRSPSGYQVIYLTGPPASGKSTLVQTLHQAIQPMESFSYNKVLAEYVGQRASGPLSEDQIRQQSAQVVTPEDVVIVDNLLIRFVNERRQSSHIVIDSHAITKESFGFRATPFRLEILKALDPTYIFMLYCGCTTTVDRIRSHSQGRPLVTEDEARLHCDLQASVALIYSILLGVPVYFLDSSKPVTDLATQIIRRL